MVSEHLVSSLRTPICDLFNIEVPIFAAGMADVTLASLAGAVSAAGGLGTLGVTFFTPDRLRAEIRAVRQITDRPFGVGLLFPTDMPIDLGKREVPAFPDFLTDLLPRVSGLHRHPRPPPLTQALAEAQVAVALNERVPVIACGLGTPEWLIERAHRVGTKIISLVGSTRQARQAEALGADCVIAQGMEAGGHTGSVTTLVLVPQTVREARIPVLAAGGIVNGAGIAAALACGAQGAWMGTRFIATPEATAHQNHKQGIVDAGENSTAVSRCYTGKPSRILRNLVQERWRQHEAEILPMPWQALRMESLVEPARANGQVDLANFPTGQGAAAIHDILPAAELVDRLVQEAVAALEQASKYIVSNP
jgi:NAD(P)H-dependent flavin oxidoreductase YrpB (nitropropane dioxygenase family)